MGTIFTAGLFNQSPDSSFKLLVWTSADAVPSLSLQNVSIWYKQQPAVLGLCALNAALYTNTQFVLFSRCLNNSLPCPNEH